MGIGCIIMHPMGIPSHCERYMGWSQLKPVLFKINSADCSDFMLCVGLSHILIFSTLVCLAQEDFSIIVSSGKVVYMASWFTLLILTFIKTVLIQFLLIHLYQKQRPPSGYLYVKFSFLCNSSDHSWYSFLNKAHVYEHIIYAHLLSTFFHCGVPLVDHMHSYKWNMKYLVAWESLSGYSLQHRRKETVRGK